MLSFSEIQARYAAKKSADAAAQAERARRFEAAQAADAGKVLAIDPSRLIGVVDPVVFDCESVYRVFHALTGDWRIEDREATWFDLIGRIVPNTYQFRFTASDWTRVYAAFTNRPHLLTPPELF